MDCVDDRGDEFHERAPYYRSQYQRPLQRGPMLFSLNAQDPLLAGAVWDRLSTVNPILAVHSPRSLVR